MRLQTSSANYAIYREVVTQFMSGNEQLPSLPTITFEIRRAIEKPSTTLLSLSKLIAKDPSLSALLFKYASSAFFQTPVPPKNMLEVLRALGLDQVTRITMMHSVKSLFTTHSPQHKRLYLEAWNRVVLKASMSVFIAYKIGKILPDHVLLGSILSEIGTFAVLSAFKKNHPIPELDIYIALCREYSKSIGIVILKKWQVDEAYINLIRNTGEWEYSNSSSIELNDIVNLGLYHSLRLRDMHVDLPPLESLAAYQKLLPPNNEISAVGGLELIHSNIGEIRNLARSLFRISYQ